MSSTEVEYLAKHEQELSQILEEMRQTEMQVNARNCAEGFGVSSMKC